MNSDFPPYSLSLFFLQQQYRVVLFRMCQVGSDWVYGEGPATPCMGWCMGWCMGGDGGGDVWLGLSVVILDMIFIWLWDQSNIGSTQVDLPQKH